MSAIAAESLVRRFVVLLTAGLALWNVGIAFVAGLAADLLSRRGWLHP